MISFRLLFIDIENAPAVCFNFCRIAIFFFGFILIETTWTTRLESITQGTDFYFQRETSCSLARTGAILTLGKKSV